MTGLFISVFNMSITASYIFVAVIIVRFFLKRAPKLFSYILWLPVFIRLIIPFSIDSALSFFNLLKLKSKTGAISYIPDNIGLMSSPKINTGIQQISSGINSVLPPASEYGSINPMQILLAAASFIWLAGIAALLVFCIFSYFQLSNKLKTATLKEENIYESERIHTPFVLGYFKPKIYIPVGIDEKELDYILEHEKTHIKRYDYIIKPLAYFALIVHWFNPLMWEAFALMTKDMEMSCDESVLKTMGTNIKSSYSNSLLTLSIAKSSLLSGTPLAFGESSIKSRIKNILSYKKPAVWVTAVAIAVTGILIASFATNPSSSESGDKNFIKEGVYQGYGIKTLLDNKTKYIGDISKVVALIDAEPLPEGVARGTIELHTEKEPYGMTVNIIMTDASNIMRDGAISGDAFYRSAIVLFSLIDNVDSIEYKISDKTGNYNGAIYGFSFDSQSVVELMGDDVRAYSDSQAKLKQLIDKINSLQFDHIPSTEEKIEGNLDIIMSSPKESSNPGDYVKAHKNEYLNIVNMGDGALDYLLLQFKKGGAKNGLREYIMMAVCKDILGDRNNVKDDSLSPQDWYSKLLIKE